MQRPERRWDKVTALGESFFLKRGLELTPLGRTPADTLRVCNLAADCMPVAVHGTCSSPADFVRTTWSVAPGLCSAGFPRMSCQGVKSKLISFLLKTITVIPK